MAELKSGVKDTLLLGVDEAPNPPPKGVEVFEPKGFEPVEEEPKAEGAAAPNADTGAVAGVPKADVTGAAAEPNAEGVAVVDPVPKADDVDAAVFEEPNADVAAGAADPNTLLPEVCPKAEVEDPAFEVEDPNDPPLPKAEGAAVPKAEGAAAPNALVWPLGFANAENAPLVVFGLGETPAPNVLGALLA